MITEIFFIWLAIFGLILYAHLKTKSKIFGVFAGIFLLVLGALVTSEGIEICKGQKTISSVGSQITNCIYEKYEGSWQIGLFLIGIAFYMIFTNALSLIKF